MLGIFMLLGAGAVALGSRVSTAARNHEYEAETYAADEAQKTIRSKTLNPHMENLISSELRSIEDKNIKYTGTLIEEIKPELDYVFKEKWRTQEDKIQWRLEMSTFPVWVVIKHILLARRGVLGGKATSPFVFYEISESEKLDCDERFVQMVEKCINESTGLDMTWIYKSYFNNTGTPTPYGGGFLIKECLPSYMLRGTARLWRKEEYI